MSFYRVDWEDIWADIDRQDDLEPVISNAKTSGDTNKDLGRDRESWSTLSYLLILPPTEWKYFSSNPHVPLHWSSRGVLLRFGLSVMSWDQWEVMKVVPWLPLTHRLLLSGQHQLSTADPQHVHISQSHSWTFCSVTIRPLQTSISTQQSAPVNS